MSNQNYNVHPKKKLHSTQAPLASRANEQDAKDLGYTDKSGKAVSKSKSGKGSLRPPQPPDDED